MKKRTASFLKAIKKENLDAFLLTDSLDIRYLTGIKDCQCWLLVGAGREIICFVSPIYYEAVKRFWPAKVLVSKNGLARCLVKEAKKLKLNRIGITSEKINLTAYCRIKRELQEAGIDLIKSKPLVDELRKIKEPREIEKIKKAVSISLEAFDFISEIQNLSMTEKDLSIEIERFLRLKSDNRTAFETIVSSGKNTAFAHHSPGENRINNFFLIDLGAVYCGYCADLTRVFFSGKIPARLKKIYDTVKKAQDKAIKKIKEGVKASDVDKAARNIIDKNGFGKYFLHGSGHGVGLQVHEPPYLKPGSDEILKAGMVLTVEPGIYYTNYFGVRLENMVIVKTKKAEVIS